MTDQRTILILTLILTFFSNRCYSDTDTLRQGEELKDWDQLISSNGVFSLKFFSFGNSMSPYLGIFYKYSSHNSHYSRNNDDPYHTDYRDDNLYDFGSNKAVWVANRNNPIPDTSGKLLINVHGRFSITYHGGTIVDLFNPTPVTTNASATLLDSGNLVLQELYPDGSVRRVLWQSFDYPTDTLLPGMKLGINFKTGHKWSLTSWASDILPATGSFTLTGDANGTSQLVLLRRGNTHWISGPWQNGQFENTQLQSSGPDVRLHYISNEDERYFIYFTKTHDTKPALTIYPDAVLRGTTLDLNVDCTRRDLFIARGCVENENARPECRKYSRFSSRDYSKPLADEYDYEKSHNLTLYDCQNICRNNCSCAAFTYTTDNRTGCKIYSQIKEWVSQEGDINRKMVYYDNSYFEGKKKRKWWIWLIIGIAVFAPLPLCYLAEKILHIRGKAKKVGKMLLHVLRGISDTALFAQFSNAYNRTEEKEMRQELHFFTFQSISFATNYFSRANKLGEGGFGAVYKGKLLDGQEVAVKRLSRTSGQGVREFTNEIHLIAKLQHTNLVRLLGCCIQREEKILVYEYMTNNSLDFFLFDPSKKEILKWRNRFIIIEGVAQGLLYLHRYSRLRVIHRDLKASNILLDNSLNPKISDFGMARLFAPNDSEAITSRVVGTRGYMAPEYMIEGTVSLKIDVFSFGVLILEIVSGKMNHTSYDVEHPLNLIGLAWELWMEGRGLELMDPVLEDSYCYKEVMTCIHVGLLCVQHHAVDRPSMSEVIYMLTNENMELSEPKRPAFFIERHEAEAAKEDMLENGSTDKQSISVVMVDTDQEQ